MFDNDQHERNYYKLFTKRFVRNYLKYINDCFYFYNDKLNHQ